MANEDRSKKMLNEVLTELFSDARDATRGLTDQGGEGSELLAAALLALTAEVRLLRDEIENGWINIRSEIDDLTRATKGR